MKKLLLFSLIPFMLLAACGKKKNIDAADMAQYLVSNISFAEQLYTLSGSDAEHYLMLNPGECDEIEACVSTNASCDEVVVIKGADVSNISKKLNEHIIRMSKEYTDYRPLEAEKLNNAVINTYKDTVTLIVASDMEAAQIVYKEYLKN